MDDQMRYEAAKKRVEELRDFYQHLAIYILINAVLIIINLLTSRNYLWFVWPLLGWGIGVAFHALSVYGEFWGAGWQERKIKEIMEKDRRRE